MTEQSNPQVPITRNIVGIIVFDGERFLLLHRVLNWHGWEYPKGGIDVGEDKETAVARELFEETGIKKFEMLGKVNEFSFYDNKRKGISMMTNFLVRVSSNSKVVLEDNQATGADGNKVIEHDGHKWCHPEEAVKLMTHDDMRGALLEAIRILGLKLKKQ